MTGRPSIRVLLADDRPLIRAGLRALLEKSPGLKIVAESTNCPEMLRLVRLRKPDVVVMDAALPNGGLQATIRLHAHQRRRVPVVLLSTAPNGHQAAEAFKASASGFLLMKAKPWELGAAIRRVVAGRRYLDSSIAGAGVAQIQCEGKSELSLGLSPRQMETLRMIVSGRNTKEIAALLGVSTKTVDFHRARLMERLKARTIAGLVREAIRHGLASLT